MAKLLLKTLDFDVLDVELGEQIGDGRAAVVHVLGGVDQRLCAKIYDDATTNAMLFHSGVAELIRRRLPIRLSPTVPGIRTEAAWPVGMLYLKDSNGEAGDFSGYAMPLVVGGVSLNDICRTPLPFDGGLVDQHTFRTLLTRAEIAGSLASALMSIHALSLVVGDVSGENVLWNAHTSTLTVIDCDTCHDTSAALSDLPRYFTEEYATPRVLRAASDGNQQGNVMPSTVNDDEFAFAILTFRLLMSGYHPFHTSNSSTRPAANSLAQNIIAGHYSFGSRTKPPKHAPQRCFDELITHELRNLFLSVFEFDRRFGLKVWRTALETLVAELRLKGRFK